MMDKGTDRVAEQAVEEAVSVLLADSSILGDRHIWVAEEIKRRARSYAQRVDTESSASRQHYIDTGRFLRIGESE